MPGPKPRQPKSKAAVVAAYRSGKTLKQIQAEFDISRATTLDILRRNRVRLRDASTVHRDAQLEYMEKNPEEFRKHNERMVGNSVAKRKKKYTVRVPTDISKEMHEEMLAAAEESGESLTAFIREAINRRLRSWRQNRK